MARAEWVGFTTIVIREFNRIIRIWGQTIVPPVVTATLYFVIFGSLIGRRVGQVGGYGYMQFIAPGLIMMAVITNSYGNVVSSFFGAKFGKHLEELLVSPLPNWLILSGYIAGGIVRGLAVGSVVTVVALFFTRLYVHHVFAIVSAVLLTSAVFALGGFINALFAKNFDHIIVVSDVRAAAAHVPRRRVLFGDHASRMGASPVACQSHPIHGQRVPVRLFR